jgi:hypothetical protein
MSKDKISDYSSTANSNTDIAGINIDEGCAPSGINDAIRTLMAQLKTWQSGGQDVYIHPAGTASAPSITANGDTNTGIFFPAADTVGISTGGTERARVDSSGNLGLGVTPSAWDTLTTLQVKNASFSGYSNNSYVSSNAYYGTSNWRYIASAAAARYEQGAGKHEWYVAGSGTAGNAITFTQAMTLDASGNLMVGGTTPTNASSGRGNIVINGSSTSILNLTVANAQAGYLYHNGTDLSVANGKNGNLVFYTNDTERARITSGGNLLVGATALPSSSVAGIALSGTSSGNISSSGSSTTAYNHWLFYNGNGLVGYISTSGSATTYSTSSDYRLKENIQPMTGALAKVVALKPCTYKWKVDGSDGEGFIAHELQEVVPQCVTGEKDAVDENGNPVYQGIDTSFLVATLTAAIQELKAEFDAYKASHP